jgi:hypothetical protein
VSLVADFLSRRFATVLGDARVIVNTHAADVQLRTTLRTLLQPA